MEILIALITSGSIRYILYALMLAGGVGYLSYKYAQGIHDAKTEAELRYNITQLEQNVKDKDTYIQQLEAISKSKSEIVAQLYKENDDLNEKIGNIREAMGKEQDRPSSDVLKDVIRDLGNMK